MRKKGREEQRGREGQESERGRGRERGAGGREEEGEGEGEGEEVTCRPCTTCSIQCTHLFELAIIIGEGHQHCQGAAHCLPHTLRLVLCQHLVQNGQHQRPTQLWLGEETQTHITPCDYHNSITANYMYMYLPQGIATCIVHIMYVLISIP